MLNHYPCVFLDYIKFVVVLAGLGDALGVDWASLVADVRRREQTAPTGGARDRWRPERVLTRLGLSLDMAGKETVQNILQKNAETSQSEKKPEAVPENAETSNTVEQNGKHNDEKEETEATFDINSLHPVAAIQVTCYFLNSRIFKLF